MVIVSDNLSRLSALPVPVPRVLSPCLVRSSFVGNDLISLVEQAETGDAFRSIIYHRVGVVLAANSCCASGVNNAVSGLYAYLNESGHSFELYGVVGGPSSLAMDNCPIIPIVCASQVDQFNNLGGTELLGYSSFSKSVVDRMVDTCVNQLHLTSLVIIAASDELPGSSLLASALFENGITVNVIPQSRNQHVFVPSGLRSTSLGFDSARRVLAELAGNIAVDCISSKKYWHFINCGDAALVGEVALLIRANLVVSEHDPLITAHEWITRVADLIVERSVFHGLRSGVVMVSQCVFSRSNEMRVLQSELEVIMNDQFPIPEHIARKRLTPNSYSLISLLPQEIRTDLLRKKKANVPKLSYFSSEEFLIDQVKTELTRRKIEWDFAFRPHFLAHESRCPVPTGFDCVLGSSLGRTAGALVANNKHGYMTVIHIADVWVPHAISIMHPNVLNQQGYMFTPHVADSLRELEPTWQYESRYRAFGPLQLPETSVCIKLDFLPFSLCPSLEAVLAQIDDSIRLPPRLSGPHLPKHLADRILRNTEPAIRLPLRCVSDMAPLEIDRLKYLPKIPAYFADPYVCMDAPVGPHACTNSELLNAVFPHSQYILPVDIVVTICASQEDQPDTHWEDAKSETDASDISERVSLRPSARSLISAPYLDQISSVLSPKARILPPLTSQLVRPATTWTKTPTRNASETSLPLLRRKSSPFRSELSLAPRGVSIESAPRLRKYLSNPQWSEVGKVGIVFLCSQVPGCHNVVSGLFDYLRASSNCSLVGFLGGATGLKNAWYHELTPQMIDTYRNQGGQDLLGHFGESLETPKDFSDALSTIKSLGLHALVCVGNLEGQLTAALINEHLMSDPSSICSLISVAASAENEIPLLRQSIGCDTVSRIFANTIANLFTEAQSSRHRWYFVKLMSHHVSHLALECAILTHPNIVLVTEEVALRKQSAAAITNMIADCIEKRARMGKEYGIVLIPDGVVAAIPEVRTLLRDLDCIMSKSKKNACKMPIAMRLELVQAQLSEFSCTIFKQLPRFVQAHLINGNTRHAETGKIDIANVASERILQYLVLEELARRDGLNQIEILVHSLAHQGRSSLPTDFDCDLAYTCGYAAGILLDAGRTGLLTSITPHSSDGWAVGGIPIVSLVKVSDSHVVSIDPTKLVMRGTRCSVLTDLLPPPETRQGHQPGPYQFGKCGDIEKTMASSDASWIAYKRIVDDSRRILESVGQTRNARLVMDAIEHTLKMVEEIEHRKYGKVDLGDKMEPDDILSTCTPHRVVSS